MKYYINGIKKEMEIKDEDLERYGKCHECGKPSSWAGKLYWYNNFITDNVFCRE